jgi:hypothetical protein
MLYDFSISGQLQNHPRDILHFSQNKEKANGSGNSNGIKT